MKKLIALLLMISMVTISLGCGKSDTKPATKAETKAAEPTKAATP